MYSVGKTVKAGKEYSHSELVTRGARWLRLRYKCKAVFEEFPSPTGEIPDVIGWKSNGRSVMIECKTSKADFLADAHKPHRMNLGIAVGAERYYLAPPKMISPEALPADWGLLEIRGNGISIAVPARPRKDLRSEIAMKYELRMLISALGRIQIRLWPATVTDWIKIENRELNPHQMASFAIETEDDRLAREGWQDVTDPNNLTIDPASGEPWCAIHDETFATCACMRPFQDDCEYVRYDDRWLGRKRNFLRDGVPCNHPGCLNHCSHPCEGCGRIAGINFHPPEPLVPPVPEFSM